MPNAFNLFMHTKITRQWNFTLTLSFTSGKLDLLKKQKSLSEIDASAIYQSLFYRDTWSSTEVQPMRDRRSFPSAVVADDEMYVLGGYDGNDTLRSVECYNFNTQEWTQVPPMNTPRSNAGACVFNNKIYLVGGWDGISLNSVESFDIATRVWQRMPSLPRPTTGVRCCFLSFQSTNEQKPKSRASRGHMCIIC